MKVKVVSDSHASANPAYGFHVIDAQTGDLVEDVTDITIKLNRQGECKVILELDGVDVDFDISTPTGAA